ncbi:diadenylate cyclase CdaA [soil metagenome]
MLDALAEFGAAYWRDVLEVLILSGILYLGYSYFRETRGVHVLILLAGAMISLTLLAQLADLAVVGWMVRWLSAFLLIAMVIIFQPELRRALAEIGSHRFFSLTKQKAEFVERMDEVVRKLSAKRYGALFAIERRIDLDQYLETGVVIDGEFSNELILTIFHPKTALHDGGMIVRQDNIEGAGCVFPISQREMMDRSIGLRHRAGMGITEETDAIAVVVSEETGNVSICHKGQIERDLDSEEFKQRLAELLILDREKKDEDSTESTTPKRDGSATSKLQS